jgi:hypothetical protein
VLTYQDLSDGGKGDLFGDTPARRSVTYTSTVPADPYKS